MGFFKKLGKLLSAPAPPEMSYWVYVKCSRCGEKIRTRVDLRNDLSLNYGEGNEPDSYFTRKTIIGEGRCYQPIEVELVFDRRRQLVDRQIRGGEFITEEEYQPDAAD